MLVLSRKPGERIVVPNCGLTLTVVSVQGKTVRLGIAAPDSVEVYREEVGPRSALDPPPASPAREERGD